MNPEKINISDKRERYQFTAYVGHVSSEMGLLGQYENAINIIIKEIKETKTRIDIVSHPILYMMRHSMELGYKSNFEYLEKYSNRKTSNKLKKSHDLGKLHAELKEHFDLISKSLSFDQELVNKFHSYFDQTTEFITNLKPSESSSFRYSKNIKRLKIFQQTDTIDIGELKEQYDRAITLLVHTADVISPYTDYKDLADQIPDFNNGTGTVLMTFPSFQLNFIADNLDKQYEKLDPLEWKDTANDQILRIITVKETCYLTPMKK